MSRLFYPILFSVTAALAATLWVRHGLPVHWLTALDAAAALAQPPAQTDARAAPPWNGAAKSTRGARRLPPVAPSGVGPPADYAGRSRQGPYTQLQIDAPGGSRALEVTRPMPVESAKVMAQIGNEVILAADVLPQVTENFKHRAPQYPKEQHEQLFQILMHQEVQQAVQHKLIVAAMKKDIPEDKLPEMEKQILKYFEDEKLPELRRQWKVQSDTDLDAKLRERGTTLKRQKQGFIDAALVSEWLNKEIKIDKHVSHDAMLKFYQQHYAEYEFPAKVKFEAIRVNYGRHRSKGETWRSVCDLGNKVYAGARMADLAKAHSEGVKAEDGGLHDWTSQGSLKCKELDAALFTLPSGVLSNPIDDGRGYLIVRVLERKEAGVTSFHDAQAGIKEKIIAQRTEEARNKILAAFFEKEKAKAWTIYDDMIAKRTEEAQKPRDRLARKPGDAHR